MAELSDFPAHDHHYTCGKDFCDNCGDCMDCYGDYCDPWCWTPLPWHCCEESVKAVKAVKTA